MIVYVLCKCGAEFFVPDGTRCMCVCGATPVKLSDAARRVRHVVQVRASVLDRISRQVTGNRGLGDLVSHYEQRARDLGLFTIAKTLDQVLSCCSCDRNVAIQTLNRQGWPEPGK
jgi:hypothetical protein